MEGSDQGFILIPTNHVKHAVLTAIQGLINTLGSLLYSPLCVRSYVSTDERYLLIAMVAFRYPQKKKKKVFLWVKIPAVWFFWNTAISVQESISWLMHSKPRVTAECSISSGQAGEVASMHRQSEQCQKGAAQATDALQIKRRAAELFWQQACWSGEQEFCLWGGNTYVPASPFIQRGQRYFQHQISFRKYRCASIL